MVMLNVSFDLLKLYLMVWSVFEIYIMPATFFHRMVLTIGFLSLFHAAYSAAQRK